MISFIWPPGTPMLAGTGGSETYTAGHVRELLRRGIAAQVVTIGLGTKDGRDDFPDIPFVSFRDKSGISTLLGTVVFINRAYDVPTKNKAAIILHSVISKANEREARKNETKGKTIISTSIFSGQQWALYLGIPSSRIHIVLPFADPIFGSVSRPKPNKNIRIIYAGRLHPDKGIYTILEMLHDKPLREKGYVFSIVMAGKQFENGSMIANMLKKYPYARLIEPIKTVPNMAKLLAHSDILLMPSVCAESFGMLSVEAQHAGCRVVASNLGGIPETNCGLLTLVEPRDPVELIDGIEKAVALGPANKKERTEARGKFMLDESVDGLLATLHL